MGTTDVKVLSSDRRAVAALLPMHGSNRQVAKKAGIDPAALRRWLAGKSGISPTNLVSLYVQVGLLPDSLNPNPERVHLWMPRREPVVEEVRAALEVFYREPPMVAEAPWSRMGLERVKKLARLDLRPEVWAFYDRRIMVILRPPAGLTIKAQELGYPWRGGTRETGVLDEFSLRLLLKEEPTTDDFRRAWDGAKDRTLEDLDFAVKALGISYEEAIRKLTAEHP